MTLSPQDLPTLDELKKRGTPVPGRELTTEEKAKAKADKAARPTPFQTKRKSEGLCKRHFLKFTGVKLTKVRDDLVRNQNGGNYRVSEDVDFRGDIALRVSGRTRMYPLRVEAKGVTLQESAKGLVGAFTLSSLSEIQREYLEANRQRGGLSVVHLSWWHLGKCQMAHLVSWKIWQEMEKELADRASGNFKGKSLRYHEDIGIIYDCMIFRLKVGGHWTMVRSHWLKKFLPEKGYEQPKLLPI